MGVPEPKGNTVVTRGDDPGVTVTGARDPESAAPGAVGV